MATTAQNRQLEELKRDLFSEDDAVVMRALNKTREKGTSALVEPLITLYSITDNQTFKGEIADMLASLKVSGIDAIFANALANPANAHIRKDLLQFMWSSGLQPVKYLSVITDMALAGPYLVTLEALTLLESIDDAIAEDQILDGVTRLKQAIGNKEASDLKTLWLEYLQILESKSELDDLDA